jgi:DNA polymerase-3 subunit delta
MFYIFHGEDELSQKEFLTSKLLAKFGDPAMLELNMTRFEASVSIKDLRQACQTAPFLAPVRVVIVQDLLTSKPAKETLTDLQAFLPHLPQSTRLVFLESAELKDSHALIKLARAEERGFEKLFARPQGAELTRWVLQRSSEKGGEIVPQAAQLLANIVGNDLQTLENELEKLVLYKQGNGAAIEVEDVLLLSPYAAEESIFDLVDALGNRNERRASFLYQQKLAEGEDPFYLFAMFVRQFRLLIQAKELADAGYKPAAVAQAMGVHGFVAGKLAQQARGFSMNELEQIYRHLLDVDVAVKTGEADMQTALDLLLANLTLAP